MSNTSQNSFAEGDIVEVPAEYFDYDDDLSAGESRVVFEGVWGFVYNFHFLVIFETFEGHNSLSVFF
jgi:hypothetical protein